ncbi:MAG: hypothetical protein H8K05_18300 [Nitrospira sp.]|nr:hypothetical protein [Nitrospira sp.]
MPQSSIDIIAERVPAFDGSLRRKFFVGVLVLLTFLVSTPETSNWIKFDPQSSQVWSLSLFTITFFLLVFAVGSAIELLGEVSLSRAIGGGFWGIRELFADEFAQKNQRKPSYFINRFRFYIYRLICLPVYFFKYFFKGAVGRSDYRLDITPFLSPLLSPRGVIKLDSLPQQIKDGICNPLGPKSDLAFHFLAESFTTKVDRHWARSLVNRCRDVLAICTATVVIILYGAIVQVVPFYTNHPERMAQQLREANDIIRLTNLNYDRLTSTLSSHARALEQSECTKKEGPQTSLCKHLNSVHSMLADRSNEIGRNHYHWGLSEDRYSKTGLAVLDLHELTQVIDKLNSYSLFINRIRLKDFPNHVEATKAAEELVRLSVQATSDLGKIDSTRLETDSTYSRWMRLCGLALLFCGFMWLGLWITIRNSLVSLIDGLASIDK